MDFSFELTEAQVKFAKEVRDWLDDISPKDWSTSETLRR